MEADDILQEGTKETVNRMLKRVVASESLAAAVQYKIAKDLGDAIKTTGVTLHKAGTELKESTENSIETLKKTIDDFRKSNEKTSNRLVYLTIAIAAATVVQAIYVIKLILRG